MNAISTKPGDCAAGLEHLVQDDIEVALEWVSK
jgi:hypothetical protein